jgi:multidrug efflux system outer membrane protein
LAIRRNPERIAYWRRLVPNAVLLSACAACTQGPDYVRPSVAVPASYRFDAALLPPSSEADSAAWWNAFGDEVLDGLIREAIANNRDLRVATARVDEYAAVLMGTQSQGRPQVGYGGNVSRERIIVQGTDIQSTSSNFTAILSASWELDLWGRIRRETEAARANLLATQEARRGVILTLVASVINSYVTLLDLDSRLRIAEDTVAGRRRSVALYQARRRGGTISDFEMVQVLADYESAVAAVPDLQRAIAQQEDALSILLGRNPGPIARGRNLDDLNRPVVPASLPAELLVRRPDILQAEQQLIASNAQIGAARALYFPRISLTTLGGLASVALGSLFSGTARSWSFVGEVAGPIYTGGGIRSANDQAEARRAQSLAAYERTIQNAFREVEDALVALRTSLEIEESFERRVAALDRGLVLARLRYDNGYSDSLDVLDTERNLFSAQLALAGAKADRYRALVSLYRALGGDWVDEADRLSVAGPAPEPTVRLP